MSQSGSGTPDADLEGVDLLFHRKGGSASFAAKIALSLNGVDLGCMNPITVSTCRAKCSNILHNIYYRLVYLILITLKIYYLLFIKKSSALGLQLMLNP